jgi:hypothetical protein
MTLPSPPVRSGTWLEFGSNLMAAARSTDSWLTALVGVGAGAAPTVKAETVAVAVATTAILFAWALLLRCFAAI